MKTTNQILPILKWTARISGSSVLAFVLFFVFAHLFAGDGEVAKSLDTVEILSVSFGISMLLGLFIALFKEGLGGLIATVSMIAFFIVRSDLITNPGIIGLFIIPGLIYLAFWYLRKNNSRSEVVKSEK